MAARGVRKSILARYAQRMAGNALRQPALTASNVRKQSFYSFQLPCRNVALRSARPSIVSARSRVGGEPPRVCAGVRISLVRTKSSVKNGGADGAQTPCLWARSFGCHGDVLVR